MNIKVIANKINEVAADERFEMSKFQAIRKKIKNLKRMPTHDIFTPKSIFDHYAFHIGGRPELQFNVGYEEHYGLFRYGIAFSFERSQDLTDPVQVLKGKVDKFNEYLSLYPKVFEGMKMWSYQGGKRSGITNVKPISPELVKMDTFIFIGKYFNDAPRKLLANDYLEMVETFDSLMEPYLFVERVATIVDKISRLCWNDHGWQFPSGPRGKSESIHAFEAKKGFGHEEWLFDRSRVINGYHYAFLEPLNLKSDKHAGNTYRIYLYAMNKSRKYYVGRINIAECISEPHSRKIYDIYNEIGWIDEMINEVEVVGGDSESLKSTSPDDFFNVRFKFEYTELSDELQEISESDPNLTTTRMVLLNLTNSFKMKVIDEYSPRFTKKKKSTAKRKRVFKSETEVDPIHDKMQNALDKVLRREYVDVGMEEDRVDLIGVTSKKEIHFYEIKTDSPKRSIRNALGQVMEYSHFPDLVKANEMIVVAAQIPDEETKNYLRFLRKKYKLPIYYRAFDLATNSLSARY